MPILSSEEYNPPFVLRSGHLNTIYPALFRKQANPAYTRKRIETLDGDFLDLDTLSDNHKHLVILCHGLEGSSKSQYMISIASLLSKNGFDVIALNFRSCGGEMNRLPRMYHSGETTDLDFVIKQHESQYEQISLIGYSLGGNVILKYLGAESKSISTKIVSAIGVSVPVDLAAGAKHLRKLSNRLYERKFLQTLKDKIILKHKMFPALIDISKLPSINTLIGIDDHFTGPIHGFKDAEDYYAQSNSKQFLENIKVPSLILTAIDDPFLPSECYPYEQAKDSNDLFFMPTKYGGHVGYTGFSQRHYWSDNIILRFLKNDLRYGS